MNRLLIHSDLITVGIFFYIIFVVTVSMLIFLVNNCEAYIYETSFCILVIHLKLTVPDMKSDTVFIIVMMFLLSEMLRQRLLHT